MGHDRATIEPLLTGPWIVLLHCPHLGENFSW
jgi:hypothetical protein